MKRISLALLLLLTPFIVFGEDSKKEKSKEEYIQDLDSENVELVADAEMWLGEKKEKSVLPKIEVLLKNGKTSKIRLNAAVAIGLINEKSSSAVLVEQLLVEQNSDVRYTIVLSLSRVGLESKDSYDALMQAKDRETDPFILDYIQKMEEKFKSK